MSDLYIIGCIAAMALTTYLVRMIPFAAFRRKIRSPFIRSFLYYIPYGVLGAMTLPYIFYSTGNLITAAVGFGVAFVMSYFKKPLLPVAVAACASAYVTGLVLSAFGI